MAARRGAQVVLSARSEEELQTAVEQIRSDGGQATAFAADVSQPDGMVALAQHAISTFGRIDTWVNNAGIGAYGALEQLPLGDMRRVFDVTFWGVVYGSRAAVPELRRGGGALINIGSVASDLAMPLLGIYSAAKHAVKGYTDALRMELEKDGAPISVTLIKPGSIDTPFFDNAMNTMEADPQPPPPVYAPEIVAEAILRAAERPARDVYVGGGAKAMASMRRIAPRAMDAFSEATMFRAQKASRGLTRPGSGSLYAPNHGLSERGSYEGHVRRFSAYSSVMNHPASLLAAGLLVGVGFGLLRYARGRRPAEVGGPITQ
jgi:short-subunit dehydrogenase